ncbi:sensor histidine kinase [Hydrogenophaga aquatica]
MEKNTSASPKAERPGHPQDSVWPTADESAFAPSWFVPPASAPAALPDADPWRSPARLWTYLMRARVFIAGVLLALQLFVVAQGGGPAWLLWPGLLYLAATAAVLRWARPRSSDSVWSPRWAMTLWMDLAMFALLQYFQQGNINYTPLFALPVLLAAILGPLLLALGSAAAATLLLLWDAWSISLYNPDLATTRFLQSALTGAGLFLVAWLAHQLAMRLAREQVQAQRSQALARTQTDVNALIVTGLKEGVLVLDTAGVVWHANPAAQLMLGATEASGAPRDLTRTPGWPLLHGWVQSCFAFGQDEDSELVVPAPGGGTRKLRARARPTMGDTGARACVVFLEDLRDVEARVQTEKLAAMGRVSAAVAHEIRNPLAAIAQANDLLDEDTTDPTHKRLTTMIGQNVKRLGRTVDDILDVVRLPSQADVSHLVPIPLDHAVAQIVSEWQQLRPQGERLRYTPATPHTMVAFEAEHLRRVLVNLLDNADRHASNALGAIQLRTHANPAEGAATLEVWSDGPELSTQVKEHLFEPFASSHSRSSGLGLYICRELCLRYGATLHYRRRSSGRTPGNAFVVTFKA